jgi:hypothetical protein
MKMEVAKLYEALAKAQGEMQNAILNKVNPHFRSKYADLPTIRDATIPTLAKNGLSVTQFTRVHEGNLVLVTRLAHSCGEFVEGEYPLPFAVDKPQAMGSAMTYARRYGLAAMCGIAAEEDDDGNSAEDEGKKNGKPDAPKTEPKNPPGITKFREEQRAFLKDMFSCTDYDQYVAFANTNDAKAFVEKARTQFPGDWNGDGGDIKGLRQQMVDFCNSLKATQQQAAE